MPEAFKTFPKSIYISAKENIKNFFLGIKTPIKIITNIIFSALIVYVVFNYSKITEIYIPDIFKFIATHTWESAIALFILLIIKKYLASYTQNLFSTLTNKYFMLSLAVLAIAGASAALFVPSYTNWFRENDSAKSQQTISSPQPTQSGQDTGNQQKQESKNSASELRGHLLYITGGVIAVLGLIETNRKNSQDHIRQVHAARRDRYIEAVDKLSSEKAPVRLGGVYSLVSLVDEWLDDDNIDEETRIKEGQVIINNLCSYIRSPFPLAEEIEEYEARQELEKLQKSESEKLSEEESLRLQILIKRFEDSDEYEKSKDITADYAKFHEEQDVRRTIFVEMSKRSSTFTKKKGEVIKTVPRIWSDFDFDFRRAPIFYPLNSLTIEKGNFSSAKFYSNADFSEATFTQTADFSRATFTQTTNFSWATFTQNANFRDATFTQNADFSEATFTQNAIFSRATFTQNANFSWATFTQNANFREATFTQNATFTRATFTQIANFSGATFTQNANFRDATFTQNADFSEATFTQNANFIRATFTQNANFIRATFTQNADFSWATFTRTAHFSGVTFTQKVNFDNTRFENYEPTFVSGTLRAQFSIHSAQEDYNLFSLHSNSKPIPPGEAELAGIKRKIPLETVLFDPMSPKYKDGNYSGLSEPAK